MSTELIPAQSQEVAIVVTEEQKELVKRTVAPDATEQELQLYFYDCSRRGVHPLDKLLHFTKRKGKYTPITSIDLFRMRADATGVHIGTDEPIYHGQPGTQDFAAMVRVHKLVAGQKATFTGTARWSEYYPGDGDIGFMWRKMKHLMLGKCAEALALRKAFPAQLHGLYVQEEMDQAEAKPTEKAALPAFRSASPAQALQAAAQELAGEPVEVTVEDTATPPFIWRMGKWKSAHITDIDTSYLEWFVESGKDGDHKEAARAELERRQNQVSLMGSESEEVA